MYLDEKEILFQAGLKAKIISIHSETDNYGTKTVFNLYISDEMILKERRKRTVDYAIPVILYGISQIYLGSFKFYHNNLTTKKFHAH